MFTYFYGIYVLAKNQISKLINTFSTLAISTILLGSIFNTPNWAMHEEDQEKESHFARVPSEIMSHIFSFLPLESHDPVSRVSRTWEILANDEGGGFRDLIAFKKTYKAQRAQLLGKIPTIDLLGPILNNLRKSVLLLNHRAQEDRMGFVTQLFEELQPRATKSNNFTKPASRLVNIWAPLALLRACDSFWAPDMKKWLENVVIPCLRDQRSKQNALFLLGTPEALEAQFLDLPDDKSYFLAMELCERGSVRTVFQQGITCRQKSKWQPALRYFTLALAKDPAFSEELQKEWYIEVADTYTFFEEWPKAAKFYALAIEKDPEFSALDYPAAADAHFNSKDWGNAAKYYILALEKDPDCPAHTYADVADSLYELRDWPTAAKYYSVAMEKNSNLSAWTYVKAAISYYELKNWPAAAESCTLA
ncbi:MAG TPA: F-box-like domain-containing protein, partial [Alphaproteobacteria bacterium]|nr:F-box-like domain-containing protein [Alphaproteobacteria bacterium]